jgi:hypothetical protein
VWVHIGTSDWVRARNLKKRDFDQMVEVSKRHDEARMEREAEQVQIPDVPKPADVLMFFL